MLYIQHFEQIYYKTYTDNLRSLFFNSLLREKCPNTEFFLVHIWPLFAQYSFWKVLARVIRMLIEATVVKVDLLDME